MAKDLLDEVAANVSLLIAEEMEVALVRTASGGARKRIGKKSGEEID